MKKHTQWQYCYICFIFILFVSNAYAVSFVSTKLETDGDGDGIIDDIMYSIFDECAVIETRSDSDADGTIDAIAYIIYDTGKYTTIVKSDHDADGNIDSVSYSWGENSAGEERMITEEDLDADGTIDSFTYSVYIDECSSAIMKSYEGTGSYDGTGNLIRVTYYTKDANGNTVIEESDNDADGLIDEITYMEYDEDCIAILHEIDLDNDGKIDQVLQSTHDDKCRPIRTEIDSDLVTYGIQSKSKTILEMNYTDDVYGNPIKVETHSTISQTIMGQTVNQESTVIQYTTYEYAEGDCGPSTLCPVCTNIDCDGEIDQDCDGSDKTNCLDLLSVTNVNISGINEVNTPMTITASSYNESGKTTYYRFGIIENYGTENYGSSPWTPISDYTTSNSLIHTFTKAGSYIFTVTASSSTSEPVEPKPMNGGCITIMPSGTDCLDLLKVTNVGISGTKKVNSPVTITATASNECGGDIYYRFGIIENYGTVDYSSSPWTPISEYSTSSSLSYTFTKAGSYIFTVTASDTPSEPVEPKPMNGGCITISE
ncbi:MAG: hypothetical protein GY808_06660 [Gammaproteobacteria bacterium]|nr:hypothetical protein [Gammaproteobacteria bacterium]